MVEPLATITRLRREVGQFAAALDVEIVLASECAAIQREAVAMVNVLQAVVARTAARIAETDLWRRSGHRSPAHALAQETGSSVGAAREQLAAAELLNELPAVAGAAARGELSREQLGVIAPAAAADPAKQSELVERAKKASLAELRDECQRVRASADRDPEATRRRIHRERRLRTFIDGEGAWNLHARGPVDLGAEFMARLQPLWDAAFTRARGEERTEPSDAYGFDALVDLARSAGCAFEPPGSARDGGHAEGGGEPGMTDPTSGSRAGPQACDTSIGPTAGTPGTPAASPRARAATGRHGSPSHAAGNDNLQTGRPEGRAATGTPSAPANTAATGPPGGRATTGTPSARAKADATGPPAPRGAPPPAKIIVRVDLMAILRGRPVEGEVCEIVGVGPIAVSVVKELLERSPFLAAVLTKGEQVMGVAHLGRRANMLQQTALEWSQPSCSVDGCPCTARLEKDHRDDWARVHETAFSNLDHLCPFHHGLKTTKGWGLVDGSGKRAFVPPDDPRHPRRRTAA